MNRTRRSTFCISCLLVAGLWGTAEAGGPPSATPAGVSASRPATSGARVEALLRDLIHPDFTKRLEATDALGEVDYEHLPLLVRAYNAQGDHESKLRLRSSIEHVFYRQQLEGRMGFLGVQPRVESLIYDPAAGKTVEAILMARVLSGFPAEAAGARTGDMLLEFDGRPISEIMGAERPRQPVRRVVNGKIQFVMPPSSQIDAFTNDVSQREPGSRVRMRLLRTPPDDRHLALTIADKSGETLDGASLLLVGLPQLQASAARFGPTLRHGLCVTAVAADSPAARAGLRAGDVIISAGSMPVGPNVTPDQLKELLEKAEPRSRMDLMLSRFEQVQITVTLGGRPVDRMNPNDMEIAQARFAEWWREQTGELSLRNTSDSGLPKVEPRSARALPKPTVLP